MTTRKFELIQIQTIELGSRTTSLICGNCKHLSFLKCLAFNVELEQNTLNVYPVGIWRDKVCKKAEQDKRIIIEL